MPRVIRNVGAASARQLGSQLLSEGSRTRDRADELHIETILSERAKIDRMAESVKAFAAQQKANREQRKADRAGKKSAVGGIIGTGAGAIAGLLLAPVTGGASLALTVASVGAGAAIGGSVGGAVGSLAEDSPGAGARASAQVQKAGQQLARAGNQAANRAVDLQTSKDHKGGRQEMPMDAFFGGEVDEKQFGFAEGPAVEAGKKVGINKEVQTEPERPQPIDVGFGLVFDPLTGETRSAN